MKRILSLLLILITMSSICCISAGAEAYETVDVYINGKILETDQPAIIVNDRTMVPIRAICEALNCTVKWEEGNLVYIINPIMSMGMQIGNKWITKKQVEDKDGEEYETVTKELDVPPMLINDRTLVPARAISETLNAQVEWKEFDQTVEITMEYDAIDDFSEGFAGVLSDGKWGYINEQRELVIAAEYDDVKPFYNGYARVQKDAHWGLIDTSGNAVVPMQYNGLMNRFRYGYLAVKKEGKWGFVNEKGELVIPTVYEDVDRIEDGFSMAELAAVKKDGKWGYIDTNGNVVVPFEYDGAKGFQKSYAAVKKGDKWGYINKEGNLVLDYQYDDAFSFIIDMAQVMIDGRSYLIDLEGNIIN